MHPRTLQKSGVHHTSFERKRNGAVTAMLIKVYSGPHTGLWTYRDGKVKWTLFHSEKMGDVVGHVFTYIAGQNAYPWWALIKNNHWMRGYPSAYFHVNMGKMYRGQSRRRMRRALKREPLIPKKFFTTLFSKMNPQVRNSYFKAIHEKNFATGVHHLVAKMEALITPRVNKKNEDVTFNEINQISNELVVYDMVVEAFGEKRIFLKLQELERANRRYLLDLLKMQLEYPEFGPGEPSLFLSVREVKEKHDEVGRKVAMKGDAVKTFPPSPLKETEGFRYLPDSWALKEEGLVMHHCVAGYANGCVFGGIFIYHVEKDGEEATLELVGTKLLRVQQLMRACNQAPSVALHEWVNKVVADHNRDKFLEPVKGER